MVWSSGRSIIIEKRTTTPYLQTQPHGNNERHKPLRGSPPTRKDLKHQIQTSTHTSENTVSEEEGVLTERDLLQNLRIRHLEVLEVTKTVITNLQHLQLVAISNDNTSVRSLVIDINSIVETE